MNRMIFVFGCLILFAVPHINAAEYPIDKGSVLVNGSISLAYSKSYADYYGMIVESDPVYTARLTPNVGVFVTKGFMLGPALDFSLTKYKEYNEITAGYGFKTAYYIGSGRKELYPHVGFALLFSKASEAGTTIYKGTMLIPSLGVDFMLSEKAALGVELGYSVHTYQYEETYYYYYYYGADTYTAKTIYLTVGLSVFCY